MMDKSAKNFREMGRDMGRKMRDQARATAQKRKEEYLGARVPAELRSKVIARADEMGIPVSILIRNILEQAFADDRTSMHGDEKSVTPESKTDSAQGNERNERFPSVLGWEQITMNRDMKCSACNGQVSAGSVATLGLATAGEDHVILCACCKEIA